MSSGQAKGDNLHGKAIEWKRKAEASKTKGRDQVRAYAECFTYFVESLAARPDAKRVADTARFFDRIIRANGCFDLQTARTADLASLCMRLRAVLLMQTYQNARFTSMSRQH
eukprot:UC1_evm1s1048